MGKGGFSEGSESSKLVFSIDNYLCIVCTRRRQESELGSKKEPDSKSESNLNSDG